MSIDYQRQHTRSINQVSHVTAPLTKWFTQRLEITLNGTGHCPVNHKSQQSYSFKMKMFWRFCIFLTFSFSETQLIPATESKLSRSNLFQWEQSMAERVNLLELIQEFFRILRSSQFPTAYATGISDKCKSDSLTYVQALGNFTLWALQSNHFRELINSN